MNIHYRVTKEGGACKINKLILGPSPWLSALCLVCHALGWRTIGFTSVVLLRGGVSSLVQWVMTMSVNECSMLASVLICAYCHSLYCRVSRMVCLTFCLKIWEMLFIRFYYLTLTLFSLYTFLYALSFSMASFYWFSVFRRAPQSDCHTSTFKSPSVLAPRSKSC